MGEKTSSEVRRRALLHVLVSGVVAALLLILLLKWREAGGNPRRGFVLATAVPAAWFLAQMSVFATGVPFATMARRWDSLGGAQRFLLTIAILAIAFVVFGGIGFTVVMSLTTP
jgi:F0F1-type ATP synthase assembly protein I